MIIAGFFGAWTLARIGMRRLVVVAMGLVGGSLLLMAAHDVGVDATAIFLAGFGAGWLNVGFLTAVSGRSHDYDRATNLAVTQMYFVIAVIGTPLLSGWLFHDLGQSGSFLVEGGLAVVVAVAVMGLWGWQSRQRQTAVSEYRPA
jgi:MFS family permease